MSRVPKGCSGSASVTGLADAPQPMAAPDSGWYLSRLLKMVSLISSSRALFRIFSLVSASVM